MHDAVKLQNGPIEVSFNEAEGRADSFLEPIDVFLQQGRHDMAYRLLKALRHWQGKENGVEERLSSLYRKWIPRWHFEMLNDVNRGKAFGDALATMDLRDKSVLDMGAGSGILSMLAVRNGARHVYACEMLEPLADTAKEIVRANGMAHKITIIPKSSFDIEIGRDMPVRAQVMVSETIDCGFVGEGFLGGLRHAKKSLLEPNALLVPSVVQLCGALIESPKIYHLNHVDRAQGFDVSKMNEFATPGYFGVRLNARQHWMMSEVKTLIDIDLHHPVPEGIVRTVEFEAIQTGTVHGVGFWFKVTLAPGVVLSNGPDQGDGHWTQAFATFPAPLAVRKGACYRIKVTFNDHEVNIALTEHARAHLPAAVNGTGVRAKVRSAV